MKPSSYVKSAEDGFENAMPKNSELLVAGNVTGPAPSGRITFRTKRRQQASARYNETDPPPSTLVTYLGDWQWPITRPLDVLSHRFYSAKMRRISGRLIGNCRKKLAAARRCLVPTEKFF